MDAGQFSKFSFDFFTYFIHVMILYKGESPDYYMWLELQGEIFDAPSF